MKITKVIFDFDGTLTKGGERLKEDAWEFLADPWSDEARQWLGEARRKFGQGRGSRFDILKAAIGQFGHAQAFDDVLVLAYAECYDQIVQKMLVDSGLANHAEELLEFLMENGFRLYVNSATPTPGLEKSLGVFGINNHFSLILGRPSGKIGNLRIVAGTSPMSKPEQMVFVGDGENDWKAAKAFGCHFIGVANSWNNWEKKRPKGMPKSCLITDLGEIPGKIVMFEKKR